MKRLLIVLGLLLVVSYRTEIMAKDKKQSLEARVVLLEMRLQQAIDALNGPVSDGLQLMDERTRDLNERLHKYELNAEDDKATKAVAEPDKSYALVCENLDDLNTCTINFR